MAENAKPGGLDVRALVDLHISRLTNQCGTCAWLEDRPDDERRVWDEVMADRKRYPHSAIHRAILAADENAKVGRGSVEGHRVNRHRQ